MKENDETQPSPAEDAGQHADGPPTSDRPAAEGPATDSGSQAGPPPSGSGPPSPGGHGPEAHPQGAYVRPPRLTRRAHGQDRVIGGVAGGLADYFGIDPLLVRLAFAGFSLIGGGGIVLYVLGWIFIPERGEGEVVGRARRVDAAKYLGIGLIAIATLILVDGIGFGSGDGGFGPLEHLFFATILVGLGVFLLRSSDSERGPAYQPPAYQPPPPAAYVPVSSTGGTTTAPIAGTPQTQPIPSAAFPESSIGYEHRDTKKKPRERSRLSLFTLAAVLLVTGAAAILNNIGVTSFDGGQLSALALTVLGGGLIVGAWWGRARWLIWIGVLMFPFVAFLGLVDLSMVPFDGEVGQFNEHPVSQLEITSPYELLAGDAVIDLSDFEFSSDEEARLIIDMALGKTTVRVPRDVYVEADLSLQAGEIDFFDSNRGGQGVTIVDSDGDPGSDARLTLVIDGALGQIQVERSVNRAQVEGRVSETEKKQERPKSQERERP